MFLIIEDNNKIIKANITSYYKYKDITIYKKDNYYIYLNNDFYFQDNSKVKIINENKYCVYSNMFYHPINIYIYENDNGLNDFDLFCNKNLTISCFDNADIIIKDKHLLNIELEIKNRVIISNYQNIFVNNNRYNNKTLQSGDMIDILGIRIFYYGFFLYINSFNIDIRLAKYQVNEEIVHYCQKPLYINKYYKNTTKELFFNKLEVFSPPKEVENRKLVLQIGPTITMSLAMIMMAAINIYNIYLNNGSKLSILSILIMPLTMLISGIMWPLISALVDKGSYKREYKKVKSEYLKYLNEYERDVNQEINRFIKEESVDLFNPKEIEDKLFYLDNNSDNFLKITLGYYKETKDFEIKKTQDKEIDEHLYRIKYALNNIENYPLYLNIKENNRITIVTKENKIDYYIKKIILELAYKHHYKDINIALYTKDISNYKEVLNIPHLYIKQKRLTFIDERELQEINDQPLSNPLILLSDEYIDISFNNSNIFIIYLSNNKYSLLKNTNCLVELSSNGLLRTNRIIDFKYYEEELNFDKYFNYLSSFNVKENENALTTFKDINSNLNIFNNYMMKHSSLKANFSVINNEVLSFDLHETKDGPHGLIGGSTGSGKSELIISLLLSLCIRYSPTYLNIILIDYKGGGIEESLSYNSKTIPHIIASINNLDVGVFERLMVAIDRECKRRQLLFKTLASKSSSSIMNIDEYLEINKEYGLCDIAHLLIVVDEFAELKKENPYIIKELISFSRIGRSLGLHLILATQRPNGIIDDEIWSNSHFKIALKVHSEKDSQDIIKSKEAFNITSPGEFYLQIDDSTIKAKAIYSKHDINNNDQIEVCLLDNKLKVVKKKKLKKTVIYSEATYLSKKIIETSNSLNLIPSIFSYKKPESRYRIYLADTYNHNNRNIIGEIDDYLNAKKDVLEYDINNNLLIYSNRANEINNILNILNENKKQIIVISNNKYKGLYISDSILYEDDEDIKYLFNKLENDKINNLVLVIEDINSLISYDEEYNNTIYKLIRRSSVSNYKLVIITKQSNINYKILNVIKNRLAIEIYDSQDLINIYSTKGNYEGKSYYYQDTPISFVPCIIEEFVTNDSILNNYIDKFPLDIKYEYTRDNLLIGYDKETRKKVFISDNDNLLITSYDKDVINHYRYLFVQNINVDVCIYDSDLVKKNYQSILWIGDGIYNQRLIYVEKEVKLSTYEGYFFQANKGRVIRPINNE